MCGGGKILQFVKLLVGSCPGEWGIVVPQADAEKANNQLSKQLHEVTHKLEDTNRTLHEFDVTKKKLAHENADLVKQLEEMELKYAEVSKLKMNLSNQLDDAKKIADEECRVSSTHDKIGFLFLSQYALRHFLFQWLSPPLCIVFFFPLPQWYGR